MPSELIAAFLWAQLEKAESLTQYRLNTWACYHRLIEPLEQAGLLRRPIMPMECAHNAHMYYILLPEKVHRAKIIRYLNENGINAIFHYVPLHNSPAGARLGRAHGTLVNTVSLSGRWLRLPLWVGITQEQQGRVVNCLYGALSR